jgi:osmotically-inducible protein OsmY
VVFNLENIDIEQACQSIETLMRSCECFQFTPECQAELEDLAIASRVRANVALNPPTSHLEIEVEAKGCYVAIRGKVTEADERKEVERVALAVPGVAAVNVDALIPNMRV